MPKLGLEIKRKCKFCGKAFIIKTLDSIYCCKKCSEAAYAQKKRAEAKEKKLALIAKSVPKLRDYISIREAVAIYGVERDTLYLMVRRGQIPSINIGTRLTRINRKDLEKMFVKRPIAKHIKEAPLPKKYSLEPEDCYTIGEVCESITSTTVPYVHMLGSIPFPLVKSVTMCMFQKKKLITYINQKNNEKTFITHQSDGQTPQVGVP